MSDGAQVAGLATRQLTQKGTEAAAGTAGGGPAAGEWARDVATPAAASTTRSRSTATQTTKQIPQAARACWRAASLCAHWRTCSRSAALQAFHGLPEAT